jgi:hypothetical protein
MRSVYTILLGTPQEKRPFGRLRYRWEDNIKNNLREIMFEVCIGVIWLRIGTSGGIL